MRIQMPFFLFAVSACASGWSEAADVVVQPASGSGFVIKDAGGTNERLRVNENGQVWVPVLAAGAQQSTPVCVGAGGALGPCAPGASGTVGPQGPQGPIGATGPAGPPGTPFALAYSGTDASVVSFAIANTNAGAGIALKGAAGTGTGVLGQSITGDGVQGNTSSDTASGVAGINSGGIGRGVYGLSNNGDGIYGESKAVTHVGVSGFNAVGDGVYGESKAAGRSGVVGINAVGIGVYGQSSSGLAGVEGIHSGLGYGVNGVNQAASSSGFTGHEAGVAGTGDIADGVRGESNLGAGVQGISHAIGVRGRSDSNSGFPGVWGSNSGTGPGVMGDSAGGFAGDFNGNVRVSGTLSKSAGSFKIDHPLDPANKYLLHSFVESPDMKNVYDGIVTLNGAGEAIVVLPDWFKALNGTVEQDSFRYQLTCIGGHAPVYIADEIHDNRFRIAGGIPGLRVSWQVTGIRHDAYAEKNRIVVEQDKPPAERGSYQNPEAFGLPQSMGMPRPVLPGQAAKQMQTPQSTAH